MWRYLLLNVCNRLFIGDLFLFKLRKADLRMVCDFFELDFYYFFWIRLIFGSETDFVFRLRYSGSFPNVCEIVAFWLFRIVIKVISRNLRRRGKDWFGVILRIWFETLRTIEIVKFVKDFSNVSDIGLVLGQFRKFISVHREIS